jgi:hypothetical protein
VIVRGKVWKALGIDMIIKEKLQIDKAGQVTLEHLICLGKKKKSPVQGHSNLQTMFMIGIWYIWWARRQHINEEKRQKQGNTEVSRGMDGINHHAVL